MAVVTVAIMLLAAPLLPRAFGDTAPVVQSPMTVNQTVRSAVMISVPISPSLDVDSGSRTLGSVSWEVWSSAARGYKLTVSTDRSPALRDAAGTRTVPDMTGSPRPWADQTGASFGFTVAGTDSLSRFDDGSKWRGLTGAKEIEVARHRSGANAARRTTVKLSAESGSGWSASSKPRAVIVATAVGNL